MHPYRWPSPSLDHLSASLDYFPAPLVGARLVSTTTPLGTPRLRAFTRQHHGNEEIPTLKPFWLLLPRKPGVRRDQVLAGWRF